MRLHPTQSKLIIILFGWLLTTLGLPAHAQHPVIGVNLTSDNLFADAMRSASPHWDSPTNFGDGSASEDANGWPTQDASIMVWAGRQYNEGTYTLIFNGTAKVDASYGYATISPQNPNGTTGNYNSSSNTTTATVVVSSGFQNFSLIFTNTNRSSSGGGAGVTNVRLYRPIGNGGSSSYPSGTTFTNDIKAVAAKFSVLRFMDLGDTNNTNQTNWSDRKLPGNVNQNQPIAWEYMVQLANETGDDLYINIPILATNDYVTKLAQLIAYGSDGVNPYTSTQSNPAYAPLNSNRHVYIEFSNEVWNFGTNAATNLLAMVKNDIANQTAELSVINFDGLDVSGPDSNGDYQSQYTLMWRLLAKRLKETSDIFRTVFGSGAMPPNANPRIRPILEYQYDNDQNTAITELSFLDNYYNNGDGSTHTGTPQPVYYFLWGGGGASYFGSNNDNASSIDGIFASGVPSSGFSDTIEGEASWAKVFGLKTIAYEGGWSVQASGGNGYENAAGSPAAESKYDSRATQGEIDAQNIFNQEGGDVNVLYTESSFDHNYVWGMTDNVENLSVPLYQAIDTLNNSTQAATTAGTSIPADVPAGAYHGSSNPTSTEVDFVRNGWSNNYLVEAPSAGNYSLKINFDSGNSNPNIVRVLVNGNATTFNLTGIGYGASSAVDSSPATIQLNAGLNGIRIVVLSADINLHFLRISSAGSGGTSPAATPTFSPGGGTYSSAQSVSIADITSGATIYYTTNGSTPTTSSAVYSGPINVSSTQTLKAIATASGYTTSGTASATYTISSGSGGSEAPYNGPHNIPGKVEAEDYDTGGQGVGYNQTNQGSATGYRTDNNSAVEANSADSNGYDLGWAGPGQWTKYTVVVANAGTYTVSFSVSSPNGQTGAFHLQNAAGTNLSGSINVPNTGGNFNWQGVTATVTLPAGTQTLEVAQDSGSGNWNLDAFTFTAQSGGSGSAYNGPHNLPGIVQAEDYDTGGQGVGYNQTNSGGGYGYRTDNNAAVEPNSSDSNGYNVGWTASGQWTKYTVVAASAGTYTVSFVVASPSGQTDAFHLQNAAGTNLSGNINVPSTGGWYSWQTVTATVTLPAGTQTLEIAQDNGNWNLDDFSFAQSGSSQTQVSLSSAVNLAGIYSDGTTFSGGLDGQGYAYSSNLLGTSLIVSGTTFNFVSANQSNIVSGSNGPSVALPSGHFSSLKFLGAAVNGSQGSQTFTVRYTDNSTTQFQVSISDWYSPQSYAGETTAKQMAYRNTGSGTQDNRTFYLYGYSLALNNAKTVQSVTLPNNSNVMVAAMTLVP